MEDAPGSYLSKKKKRKKAEGEMRLAIHDICKQIGKKKKLTP